MKKEITEFWYVFLMCVGFGIVGFVCGVMVEGGNDSKYLDFCRSELRQCSLKCDSVIYSTGGYDNEYVKVYQGIRLRGEYTDMWITGDQLCFVEKDTGYILPESCIQHTLSLNKSIYPEIYGGKHD